jgi:hypothetical protein
MWGLKDGFTVEGNKVNKKGASHKSKPSSVPWGIVDSYPALTWEVVTLVEVIL